MQSHYTWQLALIGLFVQFCGPPGMGKTQLGIQLAVHTQIPADLGGLAGKSVYVDTEGSFTAMRAEDMSRYTRVRAQL